jgi:cytochrome c oxidase subunit IV
VDLSLPTTLFDRVKIEKGSDTRCRTQGETRALLSMAHDHSHPWKRLGNGKLLTEEAEESLGHILSLKAYMNVLLALLFLTVITVVASRYDFGSWNTVIAIVIATIKAGLVASFFMHLKFEKKLIIMYAFYPLIILFLLIGGTVKDDETREVPQEVLPAVMQIH